MRELIRGAVLNTDDNLYVEFRGARDMARRGNEGQVQTYALLEGLATPIEEVLSEPAALAHSRRRLGALIEGLRVVERPTVRYEAMLLAARGG